MVEEQTTKKIKKINVTIESTGKVYNVNSGSRVKKLIKLAKIKMSTRIMAAEMDGRLVELNYRMSRNCSIKFLDYTNQDAMRMYRRGICFVLIKAAKKIFPKYDLIIRYSTTNGLYCSFPSGTQVLSDKELLFLREEMIHLIEERHAFVRKEMQVTEAVSIFKSRKMFDKIRVLKHIEKDVTHLYYLGKSVNYFYGFLPPDTGYVDIFELESMSPGFVLRFPKHFSPDRVPDSRHMVKLSDTFREYERWAQRLNIEDVGSVNEMIANKKDHEMVQIAEAMHEKKIANIADQITHNFYRVRVVLVAGPSSSGKTTFTKRLGLHLKANGLDMIQISLDNYFLDREETPRDESGGFNFENIEALDLEMFNKHLSALIEGKSVELPKYDFTEGRKFPSGKKTKIHRDQLILIEGIHGLNDKLTYSIPHEKKFKIYVSPITHLGFDNNNVISNTDFRQIRRIVRDNFFRNYPVEKTMEMWPKVRRGERENIFVFLDDADVLFNSALVYEMNILKGYIDPQLESISEDSPYYNEARRLLNFTSRFIQLNCPQDVPPTSILREFIGGSALKY
jgi:uridine kinase